MSAVWVFFAVTGWSSVAIVLVALKSGRIDRGLPDPPPSTTPLFDRTAHDLGIQPEIPFSVGNETDVIQALRVARGERLLEHRGYRPRTVNVGAAERPARCAMSPAPNFLTSPTRTNR